MMTDKNVRALALIVAVFADIMSMKAANEMRRYNGDSIAYGENDFFAKSRELAEIAESLEDKS